MAIPHWGKIFRISWRIACGLCVGLDAALLLFYFSPYLEVLVSTPLYSWSKDVIFSGLVREKVMHVKARFVASLS